MKISLITPTYDRPDEIVRLLDSVSSDIPDGVEVEFLLFDQNGDGRFEHLCDPFRDRIEVIYVRSDVNSIPCARNRGLDLMSGDIFAIPDDDCVYPAGTLEKVVRFFRDNPEYSALVGKPESIGGRRPLLRTPRAARDILPHDGLPLGIAYTCFYRPDGGRVRFDKRFGIGEEFGSGCDSDYLISRLVAGGRGRFDPDLVILHPDKEIQGGRTDSQRERTIGSGFGALLRKHMFYGRVPGMLPEFLSAMAVRPVGGVILNLLLLRPGWARLHWSKLAGRWQGFLSYRPDIDVPNNGGVD